MWDLPGPGLEPVSPALAGGFLTTAPPGKPMYFTFRGLFSSAYTNGGVAYLTHKDQHTHTHTHTHTPKPF